MAAEQKRDCDDLTGNIQIIDKLNELPTHFSRAAHIRIPCDGNLGIVNSGYWNTKEDKDAINNTVCYLNHVCWLEFRNSMKIEVPPGKYALCMRMKLDAFRFHGVWKIGNDIKSKQVQPLQAYHRGRILRNDVDEEYKALDDCIIYQHKVGEGIFKDHVENGWFWVYFGEFEIKSGSDQLIHLHFLGGNTYGCRGLGLDVIEVYKLDSLNKEEVIKLIHELDDKCALLPEILQTIMEFANDINFIL